MNQSEEFIKKLELQKHPEGGWFRECFRSEIIIPAFALPDHKADRCCYTSIFYLLEENDFSSFHRLKSDELWYYHQGDCVEIFSIDPDGKLQRNLLGKDIDNGHQMQIVIPAGCWFAAQAVSSGKYALMGCMVSPGFDFDDFEMGNAENLIQKFPQHEEVIKKFCRN
ncbi:MAG: cupin domain-containing protein [Bacteroidota bacterium]